MGNLFTFLLIGLALVWGFWLIFKRDLMSINLGKLVSYFVGVVFTLVVVLLITTKFLPWWAGKLVTDTQNSARVQEVEKAVQNLWQQSVSSETLVATAIPGPTPTAIAGVPHPTPAPTQQISSQSVTGERTHIVVSGDTLYSLSKKYGVSIDAIQKKNNLPNTNIQVGQQLIIPAQ